MIRYSIFYIVYSVIVSFFMSFIMSGTVTLVPLGFSEHFFSVWLFKSFPTSYVIALPTSLFIIPALASPANKISEFIAKKMKHKNKQ